MFITFEGIDGTGKSTQINLLEEYLSAKGHPFLSIREPGGTDLAEQIREILLNTKSQISEISELLLFEAARADLTEKVIIPAIKNEIIVISDRFFDSTTAYQGYGRGIDLEYVKVCNALATHNIKPDYTFYFRLPLGESIQRRNAKLLDRMESSGEEFFERVIGGFEQIAIQNPERIKVIDASRSREEIFQEILDILNW